MTIFDKLVTAENEADNFGFRWENAGQILAQIQSECAEVKVHLENVTNMTELQEEIGDLLHAVFSLCVFYKFNPAETLEKSVDKFTRRFYEVKRLAQQQGLTTLNGKSFDELMA